MRLCSALFCCCTSCCQIKVSRQLHKSHDFTGRTTSPTVKLQSTHGFPFRNYSSEDSTASDDATPTRQRPRGGHRPNSKRQQRILPGRQRLEAQPPHACTPAGQRLLPRYGAAKKTTRRPSRRVDEARNSHSPRKHRRVRYWYRYETLC